MLQLRLEKSESGILRVVALLILGHELRDGFNTSVSNSVFVLIKFGHYSIGIYYGNGIICKFVKFSNMHSGLLYY
jgi:hypothetical protein